MWSGPIHEKEFVANVLEHVEGNEDSYGTSARMKGMLTVAKEVCFTQLYIMTSAAEMASMCPRSWTFHSTSPLLRCQASSIVYAPHWMIWRKSVSTSARSEIEVRHGM